MAELKEGLVGGALNLYFIYKFLRILTTPWESTDAFKLGIVDEKGAILRKKRTLLKIEEKEAYTMMHRLVWKLKRLMEKVPFGKSRLASYAAALWLIKEEKEFHGTDEELQESFLTFLETDWKNNALILKEKYEGDMDKKTFSNLRKEGIDIKKSSMKDVIKDFQKSDAPQFKGKSDEKKKEMAIAAKLSKEEVEVDEANLNDFVAKFKQKMGKTTHQTMTDWVDGIGELTKRENKTLKRVLEPFTEEVTIGDVLDQIVEDSEIDEWVIEESAGLQLKMAFDDAKIKIKGVKSGKLVIAKKDKKEVEKIIAKQMKKPADAKRVLGSQIVFEDVELAEKGTAYPATVDTLRKIVKDKQHQTVMFDKGQAMVDLFTASAMVQVYDALKPATKKKFEDMIKSKEGFMKSQAFAMKMAK